MTSPTAGKSPKKSAEGYFAPYRDLMFEENHSIFAAYHAYLEEGTELTLATSLLYLARK